MGLDVVFDRQTAIDAGLELKVLPNGTPEEIGAELDEINEGNGDLDYLEWLQERQECVKVPGCSWYVSNDGVNSYIIVRANKWGSTYAPLTNWLKANGIEWSEC